MHKKVSFKTKSDASSNGSADSAKPTSQEVIGKKRKVSVESILINFSVLQIYCY